ncbi:MAG: Bcr/CflA family efflux MFS transporter [Firmicutes bacterium]|nr:Bcr/CflA family efflux MFS transporter [Bacillota bacterium]
MDSFSPIRSQKTEQAEKQTILGHKGLIVFLILSNTFVPLSTDMYLPALPNMSRFFSATTAVTNLTLTVFFLFYGVATIFWGPFCDKYGRRPCIIAGAVCYAAASLACAASVSIQMLIAARIFQAIGAGAIITISMAIVKDCFIGSARERILAFIYTMGGLAPMLAPVLGGQILRFFNWRYVFLTLALLGMICLSLALCFKETQPEAERCRGKLADSFHRFHILLKEKSFIIPVVLFALPMIPFMGYIALSSYIYEGFFGLSEQAYSFFFAANAFICMLSPSFYLRFVADKPKALIGALIFLTDSVLGLLMICIGSIAPWTFWLSFVGFGFVHGACRTFSVNLILDQHQGDSGSAASLIASSGILFGSVGTVLASSALGVFPIVPTLGALMFLFCFLPLLGWRLFLKSSIPCAGVK